MTDRRSRSARFARRGFVPLLVACWALFLRLPALEVSAPHHEFVPDEHVVRAALSMARDRDLCPPPGRDTTYPYLMPYVLLPAYACHYTYLRATGDVTSPAAYGQRALEQPFGMFVIARFVVALFGTLATLGSMRLARTLGASSLGAFTAGVLSASSLLLLLLSVQARPWIPVMACTVFVFDGLARALRGIASGRPLILTGVAAGAAAGFHPVGFATLVPFAMAAMAGRRSHAGAALAASFVMVCVLACAYPWVWLGVAREPSGIFEGAAVTMGGQGVFLRFDGSRLGSNALALLTAEPWLPALVLLASIPRGRAIRQERVPRDPTIARRVVSYLGCAYVMAFLLYFGTLPRYFLPALPVLAAALTASVWPLGRRAGVWRIATASLLTFSTAATGLRMTWVLEQEDTRVRAERSWADSLSTAGVVAIEAHGPRFVHGSASLERLRAIDPTGITRRERAALENPLEGVAVAWIPLERVFRDRTLETWTRGYELFWSDRGRPGLGAAFDSGDPLETRLAWTFAAERVVAIVRVRRGIDDEAHDLEAWLRARHATRVARFDPGTRDALLPTEPRFGWFTVWSADRPGPALELFRVP